MKMRLPASALPAAALAVLLAGCDSPTTPDEALKPADFTLAYGGVHAGTIEASFAPQVRNGEIVAESYAVAVIDKSNPADRSMVILAADLRRAPLGDMAALVVFNYAGTTFTFGDSCFDEETFDLSGCALGFLALNIHVDETFTGEDPRVFHLVEGTLSLTQFSQTQGVRGTVSGQAYSVDPATGEIDTTRRITVSNASFHLPVWDLSDFPDDGFNASISPTGDAGTTTGSLLRPDVKSFFATVR